MTTFHEVPTRSKSVCCSRDEILVPAIIRPDRHPRLPHSTFINHLKAGRDGLTKTQHLHFYRYYMHRCLPYLKEMLVFTTLGICCSPSSFGATSCSYRKMPMMIGPTCDGIHTLLKKFIKHTLLIKRARFNIEVNLFNSHATIQFDIFTG
jgi:hypothetical protein